MADSKTLRVLALPGGGTRGIFQNKFMELLCQQAGINPNEIWKLYDVICGSSVGAINGAGYAAGFNPSQMRDFYINDAPWIFSTSSIFPSVRPSILSKVATLLLGGSFYSNDILIQRLTEEFGTKTMQDLKTNVLFTSYAPGTESPILFSNLNFPSSIGQDYLVKDVVLSSAAPPIYFPAYPINGIPLIDGGVWLNNPASMGLSVGKSIKPNATRFCITTVGTGRGDIGFDTEPIPPTPNPGDPPSPPFYNNMYFLFKQIGRGIAAPAEAVSKDLEIQGAFTSNNTFPYYFQADLEESEDTELDNTSTHFFNYIEQAAVERFNDDIVNITSHIGHLLA
jgi:hypothetical protein